MFYFEHASSTSDQKVHIYVRAKALHSAYAKWRGGKGRFENPPFNLLPTRLRPSFHTMCTLPLASCQTRRALSSTGATCSEENTSDIDKNCLFFPPASLLIRAPCFYTSHPAAARRDVLAGRGVFALHQVDLPAESSLAFLLHKSCLKTRLTESTRAGS